MVRKEAEGWRIGGMAVPIFEGEPLVLMNFEDPEDMLRKQKLVHDEIQRRAQEQAKGKASAGETMPSVDGPVLENGARTPDATAQTSPSSQTPASPQPTSATNAANSAGNQATAPENSLRR